MSAVKSSLPDQVDQSLNSYPLCVLVPGSHTGFPIVSKERQYQTAGISTCDIAGLYLLSVGAATLPTRTKTFWILLTKHFLRARLMGKQWN